MTPKVYAVSTLPHNQPVAITKRVVDLATPVEGKRQAFIRDARLPGFGLRITDSGTKSFIVEKRVNGRVRRVTLGRYGVLTVEEARREAQKHLAKLAMGTDPIAERRAARAQAVKLSEAFDTFLKARKNLRPKTRHGYAYHLNHYLGSWMRKPITDITTNMVSRRHREIGAKNGKMQANSVMRTLRAVLNFAKYEYLDGQGYPVLRGNPVDILNHHRAWYRQERRRTLIKRHQLPAWYAAVQALKAPDKPTSAHVIADFLVFVLFTGLRFNEAARLRWADVDLLDRSLFLAKPKNGEPFTLPLSDFVIDLLKEREALAVNGFVFPDRDGRGHLIEPKRQMAQVIEQSRVSFKVHDLRRTFITVAESLDISPYALKRLVNHKVSDDVTDGYIISDVERLRAPMQRVTDFLQQIIAPVTGKELPQ